MFTSGLWLLLVGYLLLPIVLFSPMFQKSCLLFFSRGLFDDDAPQLVFDDAVHQLSIDGKIHISLEIKSGTIRIWGAFVNDFDGGREPGYDKGISVSTFGFIVHGVVQTPLGIFGPSDVDVVVIPRVATQRFEGYFCD